MAVPAIPLMKPGDLRFLSQKANLGRKAIMEFALRPNSRKEPPYFSAGRTASILGVDKKTVISAARELSLKSAEEQSPDRFALSLEDLALIRGRLGLNPAKRKAPIIATINQKGGVGKTTTTLHFVHFAALRGYRTLVVDLDSQASLTSMFGYCPDVEIDIAQSAYPVLVGDTDTIEPNILPCPNFADIAFVPACLDLSSANEVAYERAMRETHTQQLAKQHGFAHTPSEFLFWTQLKRVLDPLRSSYDFIVLDCPPHLSTPSYNAIYAADIVFVPLSANMLDLASTLRFINWLESLSSRFAGMSIKAVQFLITNFDSTPAAIEAAQTTAQIMGGNLISNIAYHSSEVQRASLMMKSIYELHKPVGSRGAWARAAETMDALNAELLAVAESVRTTMFKETV